MGKTAVYRYQFISDRGTSAAGTSFQVRSKVWLYPGAAAWHFITIPARTSRKIKRAFGSRAGGWGSLPVRVVLGRSEWRTSIFPDKKAGAYILPLKAEVRAREGVRSGQAVRLELEIRSEARIPASAVASPRKGV